MSAPQLIVREPTQLNRNRPTQADQVSEILQALGPEHEDIVLLKNYIDLLRRQALKAKNQRKTLRELHKAYKATIMENRWMRGRPCGPVRRQVWLGRIKYWETVAGYSVEAIQKGNADGPKSVSREAHEMIFWMYIAIGVIYATWVLDTVKHPLR